MKIADSLHGFIWNSMTANNCNTYLIDSTKRILIDPGHARLFEHVLQGLHVLGLEPKDIDLVICTHSHPDHIEAVEFFKREHVPFALHEAEWDMVRRMAPLVRSTYGRGIEAFEPDFFLKEGQLDAGDIHLAVFHTPGHSPGSICLYWPDQQALFTGDLVFKAGFGRTDLPGGDPRQIEKSIERAAQLDVKWLLPGHGNIVGAREEVKANFDRVSRMIGSYRG